MSERLLSPTGDNLKALRERHGLTQRETALLMRHASAVRISQYETGYREVDPIRFELLLIQLGEHPDFCARAD